jgi:putative NADH-flavin reductase
MKIVVFGASGRTGKQVVKQALENGYQVIAFARTPTKLDVNHENLTFIQGDVQQTDKVEEAVRGAEAVISVLGPTNNIPDYQVSRGMDNVLAAMQDYGVRRLVVSIGAGVRDPQDRPGLIDQVIAWMLRTFSRHVYEDMRRVDERVRASDRDWVIVRVPMLTGGPKKGTIQTGYIGQGVGARLTRADLAEFLLKQVEGDKYLHQAPAVSN